MGETIVIGTVGLSRVSFQQPFPDRVIRQAVDGLHECLGGPAATYPRVRLRIFADVLACLRLSITSPLVVGSDPAREDR